MTSPSVTPRTSLLRCGTTECTNDSSAAAFSASSVTSRAVPNTITLRYRMLWWKTARARTSPSSNVTVRHTLRPPCGRKRCNLAASSRPRLRRPGAKSILGQDQGLSTRARECVSVNLLQKQVFL